MSNIYCNLVGSKQIKEDFKNINYGFDKVQLDIESINKDLVDVGILIDGKFVSLETIINNLSFTGSSHDPLVTAALVDARGENFGPDGAASYLNGRLSKWEMIQPILSSESPNSQPDGGIWYEILSSDSINQNGLVIENMVVQDLEPTNQDIELWGDI
jgi:hypothetical protein